VSVTQFPVNRGLRELIEPHRSYRRLPVSSTGALLTIPAVIIVEIVVVLFAQAGLDWTTDVAQLAAARAGIAVDTYDDRFLFVTLHPMTFAMRHSSWGELIAVMLICLLTVAAFTLLTRVPAPLRFYINLNALVVGGGAVYLFLTGHLGYDSAAFSELMLRTAFLTWLVVPVFVGLFAALFPFSFLERFVFVLLTVAYDVPLTIARYACFVLLLGITGPIAMCDLYLMFGPLLDAVPVICFFSIFLTQVARTLHRRRAVWDWL
jgi:hypothetical protein